MNTSVIKRVIMLMALICGANAVEAMATTSLSEMTAAEIISLLPVADSMKASAYDTHNTEAIQVSGHDLLTKAYGTINSVNSSEGTIDLARKEMKVIPTKAEDYLWLDSSNGYNLDYYGMSPEVSALVRLENDSISDYGFFFLFPYSDSDKMCVTADQVDFSTVLLQEFQDMGMDMGANPYTNDLFEVNGNYTENYVAMRLIDDSEGGRYILFLSVEPNAVGEMDKVMAN